MKLTEFVDSLKGRAMTAEEETIFDAGYEAGYITALSMALKELSVQFAFLSDLDHKEVH